MEIEIFRDIVIDGVVYENYQVSNLGRVKSLNYLHTGKERVLKPRETTDGYLQVCLWKNREKKWFSVHRLVASVFLDNPEKKPEINHIDEDKTNNFVFLNEDGTVNKEKSNLEWSTSKENSNHGTRNERITKANTNGIRSKPVLQLSLSGDLIREWESTRECGRNGFDHGHVSRCCRGEKPQYKGFRFMYK